ncbi:fungal-specific transcription factor domain-containing protein [Xylariales sp. AK1849]|nr:fungal-specific transcription factor domain-containing protein [Xylariales sp. AK1849]
MPGRKRRDQYGPVRRRTRTGCSSCRHRKVKCDEAKPKCKNCVSRGLDCDSGIQLKWHDEFEIRGAAFGREGVWTKDAARGSTPSYPMRTVAVPAKCCMIPSIGSHHFLNSALSDFEPDRGFQCGAVLDVEDQDCTVKPEPVWPALASAMVRRPSIIRPPSPFMASLDGLDTSLLEYYLRKLCPLTTSSRNYLSPFANLILPLFTAPGQEDVLHSLMALSARHRSTNDPRWSQTAMTLKGGVLASLQKRLVAADNMSPSMPDPMTLVIMMFLCLYEIVDKCDHSWVIHLRASRDIIRRSRSTAVTHPRVDAGSWAVFAERFFAFQDAISRTACGDAPLFDVEYWESHDNYTRVDPWMGCSPELAGILCEVTELGRAKATGDIPSAQFFERADILETRIHSLTSDTRVSDDEGLMSSAELKRLSASLYLHCVLYNASPSTLKVSSLVRNILERIHRLLRAGCVRALAFPVFVAAVELDSSDGVLVSHDDTGKSIHGRRLVLETLDAMSRDSLSNVTRTRAVIQKVWRLRDMHVEEEPIPQKAQAAMSQTNDWTTFVGPNSSYISLA